MSEGPIDRVTTTAELIAFIERETGFCIEIEDAILLAPRDAASMRRATDLLDPMERVTRAQKCVAPAYPYPGSLTQAFNWWLGVPVHVTNLWVWRKRRAASVGNLPLLHALVRVRAIFQTPPPIWNEFFTGIESELLTSPKAYQPINDTPRVALQDQLRNVIERLTLLTRHQSERQARTQSVRAENHRHFMEYIHICATTPEPPQSPDEVSVHLEDRRSSLTTMETLSEAMRCGRLALKKSLQSEVELRSLRTAQESLRAALQQRIDLRVTKEGALANELKVTPPITGTTTTVKKRRQRNRPAIFISYSSKDEVIIADLCRIAEHAGFPCWYSGRDLNPGADGYSAKIAESIDAAWLVIVLISEHSLTSAHVTNEIVLATNAKKSFLPFEAEGFRGELNRNFSYHLSLYQRMKLPLADAKIFVETIERLWADLGKK